MSKFKIGDRVQLIAYPGYTGVILKISDDGVLARINMDFVGERDYFISVIQLVEEPKTEQIKIYEKTVDYEHYNYWYKGVKLDPYRILSVYNITCPAQQHAIKKLLRAGNSIKELKEDITEVIDTLKRKLEMLEEDTDNT